MNYKKSIRGAMALGLAGLIVSTGTNAIANDTYTLNNSVNAYINANDALNNTNVRNTYDSGQYYIYRIHNGMYNISKSKNSPGAWINPKDNKVNLVKREAIYDLHLRDSKSFSANKIDYIYKGEVLEGEKSGDWIKITYNNKVGYVYYTATKDYEKVKEEVKEEVILTPVEETPTLPQDETSDQNTEIETVERRAIYDLYLRDAKSFSANKIDYIYKDTILEGQVEGNWLKIKFNNQVGYVYLTATEPYNLMTKIEGKSILTSNQLKRFLVANNPSIEDKYLDMVDIYLEEGEKEGIRGDLALMQSILETGWFKVFGNVNPNQYNFAGMGVTGPGVSGLAFESPRIGIRAHIQHLKAYATDKPLNQELVNPRFRYVRRGVSPYVEWLGMGENPSGAGWAAAADYGYKILNLYNRALNN